MYGILSCVIHINQTFLQFSLDHDYVNILGKLVGFAFNLKAS